MSLAMPRLNDVWWLVSKLFNKPNVEAAGGDSLGSVGCCESMVGSDE